MKRVFSVLMLLVALVFATSCQKENGNNLNVSQSENQFKDEDDHIYTVPPSISGQIFLSSGQSPQEILITFEGISVTYFASTHPDANGHFTFTNVVAGDYVRKVYENNTLLNTIGYIVEE
jgi:hypothetical protein